MNETLDYEQFVDYIVSHVPDVIARETDEEDLLHTCVIPVMRNNERVSEALRFAVGDGKPWPMIDIAPFYEMYCMGADLSLVMHELVRSYIDSRERHYLLNPDDLSDFWRVRDKIIFRLISRDRNRHILEGCPSRDFLDLSVTYRVLTGKGGGGISSVMITNSMMEGWGIDEKALFCLAIPNSVRLFPPRIQSLGEVLTRLMEGDDEDEFLESHPMDEDPEFYVCTNDCGINGAGVMCYPGLLERFGESIGEDFYILPSSIHEVLFLPAHAGLPLEDITSIVRGANKSVVSLEEILSDCVYYFKVKTGKIEKYSGQVAEELLQ